MIFDVKYTVDPCFDLSYCQLTENSIFPITRIFSCVLAEDPGDWWWLWRQLQIFQSSRHRGYCRKVVFSSVLSPKKILHTPLRKEACY